MTPRLIFWVGYVSVAGAALSQQLPHVGYVYPAGGRQGATFETVIGGQYFNSTTNFSVFVDGDCVQAKPVSYDRPLRPNEQDALKEELNKLQEKRKAGTRLTAGEIARLEEIRRKLTQFGRRPANPSISEFMTLRLTLATNAAPGDHELRVRTATGLSNPIKFCVGTLPEITKPDWKSVPKERASTDPKLPPPVDAAVTLPITVNGQIAPAGVDRYRFNARKGQQIVIAVDARRLIPYLADAVPGWFEAVIKVLDSNRREIAGASRYRFRPDPVLHFEVPQDGSYTVEIHDSIYRGREDFVYRMTIGELPFLTSIHPLGGRVGESNIVSLSGWNLSEKSMVIDSTSANSGITHVAARSVNTVPFAVDDLPETSEQEPNNSRTKAQIVVPPVIINGRIASPGQQDVFKFQGRAGQGIVAEVMARRLDSSLDSHLRLIDESGKLVAANDDSEDKGTGLNTHHADSRVAATLSADGTYYLYLSDAQGQGGADFSYRLRISPPQPDFELRIVPSSLSIRAGMSVPVTVFALRRDGFTNAIELRVKNAPAGFSLGGGQINAGEEKAKFTLKAPSQPADSPVPIVIEGHSKIDGRSVVRTAVPAEDMMQAFFYRHLVPSKSLLVSVSGQARPMLRESFQILGALPVKIPIGGTARLKITGPPGAFADRLKLELDTPPEGITLKETIPVSGGLELLFAASREQAKVGATGNLICSVKPLKPFVTGGKQKINPNQGKNAGLMTLPAIPFKVVSE